MSNTPMRHWAGLCAAGLLLTASQAWAVQFFAPLNLVSDDPIGHPALLTDSDLTNAWGMSYSPTSAFWVSSNGGGTSQVYRVNPATQVTTLPLSVTIPGAGNPTGQVFNGNAGKFNNDVFIFVSEDGTVSGWRGGIGNTAETLVVGSDDNVYKGAALGNTLGGTYLYAANFRAGKIEVFKGAPAQVDLPGSFLDPTLPSGYAPFNVQNLGDVLYVTYAKQDADKKDDVQGAGLGYVDSFDLQGNFIARVAGAGTLNAPWGLAIAPASFGAMAGDLLVGNFGDGRINIFDPVTHGLVGQVLNDLGTALEIDGLWAISPGNGVGAGSKDLLYFTAGPDGEDHGLFGVLQAVPEPSTTLMLFGGLLIMGGALWRPRSTRR